MIDNQKWLKVRADVYNKYQELPKSYETLKLHIFPADRGWIDMIFSVAEQEYKIHLSCYPEPFLPIKKWLEDIIMRVDDIDNTLVVDCDCSWETIFHFEHLTDSGESIGIFYLYDSDEDSCLSAYLRLSDLIRLIYRGILDYAIEGESTEEFREQWIEYVEADKYVDDKLSSAFRSEIIEKFLELDNRYTTRWAFTKN